MAWQAAVCLCVLAVGTMMAGPATDSVKTLPEPKYDPGSVIDFSAVVMEVRQVPKGNPLAGLHLTVKNDSDVTLTVYLGPADFIESFEITFRKSDNIHITGSKVRFGADGIVLAREVRRDSTSLYLRDRNGQPYWH